VARIDVQISTPDGTCPASLHVPEGDGPWPGVLLFPDAGGARETMRVMADRLAGMGYVALVPDVYYREGEWTPFDIATVFSDETERARLSGFMSSLTRDRIVSDTGAYLDYLLTRPEVVGTTAGTTGYCMGGRLSLITAGAHPDKVGAAASFHGGRIAVEDDPESPHLAANRISATVYVAGAEDDGSFTPEQAQLLDSALTEASVPHTVEFYPAKHGFAVPDNPTYDAAAEDRHWKALEALYGSALQT
jgi:carboxymethylenebutenolidase